MIKVGITGGMGSGKTVVSELFRLHGVPVFDADKEAKLLNDTSTRVKEGLTRHFGPGLYEGGRLNRAKLAGLIFQDEQNLAVANSIIHPVLAERFILWSQEREHHPVVVIDAAVLFEAKFERYVDQVITVFSPEEIRVERVKQRDGIDRSGAMARMQHQVPEEEKIRRADHVIYNDGNHSLIQQVANLLSDLRVTTLD